MKKNRKTVRFDYFPHITEVQSVAEDITTNATVYQYQGKYQRQVAELVRQEMNKIITAKSNDAGWRQERGLTTDEALVAYYVD